MGLVQAPARPCGAPATVSGSANTAGNGYSFAFTFYRYNASGGFLGSQKITAALELGAGGDLFASRSVIEIFDGNDNLIATGCATAAGTRFD